MPNEAPRGREEAGAPAMSRSLLRAGEDQACGTAPALARELHPSTGSSSPAVCAEEAAPVEAAKAGACSEAPCRSPSKLLLGNREQRGIVLALFGAALLLVCGPCAYCWLEQGRAELADNYRAGAHGLNGASVQTDDGGTCYSCQVSPDGHHSRALQINGKIYLNEVMSGGINGLLMMVATILAGIGADIPARGIFAMGSASLAAYSFSMGFGAFVVETAKNQFSLSQLQEEYQEVREKPQDEISEMVCHYRRRGLSEDDARNVAATLSKYEDFWVQHMMSEELGIQLPNGDSPVLTALSSGLATCASFLFFGTIPLLGVIMPVTFSRFNGPHWYRPQFSTLVALALSATALTLLGLLLGRFIGSRTPILNGLLMLGNGCVASVLALYLSKVYLHMCQGCSPRVGASSTPEPECQQSSSKSPSSTTATALPGASASADERAWPTFLRQFLYGLCALWVGVCTVIVCMQFLERMAYDSFRVFLYGGLTCITTGLGALPFAFVKVETIGESPLAIANAVAGGMMLSASLSMIWEAHDHCGPMDWQIIVGLIAGGLFIKASERLHGDEEEEDVLALHTAFIERRHWRKAVLIFTVMFCHSAAEGIAVGVAFSKQLSEQFGLYVSLLLAVHNVPEGLAVALVLVPRGVSVTLASVIATLTSVPQPLLAVAAFLFVDAFRWLLPLGLTFAAGAMVYVCLHELLHDAAEQLGWRRALQVTGLSFIVMSVTIAALHAHTGL